MIDDRAAAPAPDASSAHPGRFLADPFRLGDLPLPNRIVMAPMTRCRTPDAGVPNGMNGRYYTQRASAGLIITECATVTPQSAGILRGPGIYVGAQVAGWRLVTQAVHDAGGRIFLQIWHCGRVSHPSLQPGGEPPVAPSAIAAKGEIFTPQGRVPFTTPRALDAGEIPGIVEAFRRGAENAKAAGFDGVELHGAFGYLPDQFLQDGSNTRTDAYGGSAERRARFLLEVVEAIVSVWGRERVGCKLSPSNRHYGMYDSDARTTFGTVIGGLNDVGIAYVHLMEPDPSDLETGTVQIRHPARAFRQLFGGTMITNGGYDEATGGGAVRDGAADLVAYGRLFIANPDLPRRFADGAPLNEPDHATFYTDGAQGYVDYPALAGVEGATR